MGNGRISQRLSREWNALEGKRRAIFWIACFVALVGLGVIFSALGSDSGYSLFFLPFPMHSPVFFCFAWLSVHFLRGAGIGISLSGAPLLDIRENRCVFYLAAGSYLASLAWFLRFFKSYSQLMACFLLIAAALASGRLLWRVARTSSLLAALEVPILAWLLVNLVATLKVFVMNY